MLRVSHQRNLSGPIASARWIITRHAYLVWERTCGRRAALDFDAHQR
jgi:hypothetical protein